MPTNFERKARRKTQAKLTFDPIIPFSSSDHDVHSSAFAGSSSPAKIRYEVPRGNSARRTPMSSSTLRDQDEVESEDPLATSRSLSASRKQKQRTQTKTKSSGAAAFFKALPTPAKSSQQAQVSVYNLDDEVDVTEKSNPFQSVAKSGFGSKGKVRAASKKSKISLYNSSDGSSAEELDTPSRKGTRDIATDQSSKKSVQRQKSVTLSDSEEDPVLPPPRSTTKIFSTPSKARSTGKKVIELDSDSDSDGIAITSRPKQRQKNLVPVAVAITEDSDDEPITSPLKRRRAPVQDSDSGSDIVSSPLKRRRPTVVADEEEEIEPKEDADDTDSSLPSISKLAKSNSTTSKDNPSPARFTRQQKAPKKHRSEKQKTLELMKRKRAGEKIDKLTDTESDSEEELRGGIYDTDDELEVLDEFDDEEQENSEYDDNERVPKAKSKTKSREKNDDEYDSDFVVEEEDGPLGIPDHGLADIPLEFTHAAHKPLKEHFKDAIEWLVQNKVNPGFIRDDPVYRQAFLKLNDEVSGLAKSKFTSTQWTHEFTRTIYARPQFLERPLAEGEGFDVDGVPKCDTCNHRKHVPTFAIQFKGKAYDKDTLEDFEEDSDEDDDALSVDENGQELPNDTKEWFSGRTCRDNAQQAHTLIHWKHALNTWVVEMLEETGELEPAKLAARLKMKSKRRREDANAIVDSWEGDGHIRGLYRDFKIILDTARNASTGGRWSNR